ncbi:hypothetical protein BOX15_Mlig033771g1 [Macrostomum lignano]|uniref:Uncharacterized protein n=1 Tax=Macrostomum lignano TaxID=282301 RepID=A0A267E6I7_9PLAT|nr:hypothetical protein BOX15_Mlig033771g1 [Macrostomum lignano]
MGNTGSKLSNNTDEHWSVAAKYKVVGWSAGDGIIHVGPWESTHYDYKGFPVNIYFKHKTHSLSDTVSDSDMKSWCYGFTNMEWKLHSPSEGVIHLEYNGGYVANYKYETRSMFAARMRREKEQRMQGALEQLKQGDREQALFDQNRAEQQKAKQSAMQTENRQKWEILNAERHRALVNFNHKTNDFSRRCEATRQERLAKYEASKKQTETDRAEHFARLQKQARDRTECEQLSLADEQEQANAIRKQRLEDFQRQKVRIASETSEKISSLYKEAQETRARLRAQFEERKSTFQEQMEQKKAQMQQQSSEMQERLQLQHRQLEIGKEELYRELVDREAEIARKIEEQRRHRAEKQRESENLKKTEQFKRQILIELERERAKAMRRQFKSVSYSIQHVRGKSAQGYSNPEVSEASEVMLRDQFEENVEGALMKVLASLSNAIEDDSNQELSVAANVKTISAKDALDLFNRVWKSEGHPFGNDPTSSQLSLLQLLDEKFAQQCLDAANKVFREICFPNLELDIVSYGLLVFVLHSEKSNDIKHEQDFSALRQQLSDTRIALAHMRKLTSETAHNEPSPVTERLLQLLVVAEDVIRLWPIQQDPAAGLKRLRVVLATMLRHAGVSQYLDEKSNTECVVELITSMQHWDPVSMLKLMEFIHTSSTEPDQVREFVKMMVLSRGDPRSLSSPREAITETYIASLKKAQASQKTLDQLLDELKKTGQFDEGQLSELADVVRKVFTYFDSSGLDKALQKLKIWERGKESPLHKILIDLCKAVLKCKGYLPRHTQVFSTAALLNAFKNKASGQVLQILTGEGKSCIVAMSAVGLVRLGQKSVDVVAPSEVLAARDCKEWKDFYKICHVSVDCNIEHEDPKKCYESCIVYGTVSSFAGDTLRHEFQFKDIRGSRGFDSIIVDEVDSLLLDQGVQLTYLAQDAGDMKMLDPIFATIFRATLGCHVLNTAHGGEMVAEQQMTFLYLIKEFFSYDEEFSTLVEQLDLKQLISSEEKQSFLAQNAEPVDLSNFDIKRTIQVLEVSGEFLQNFPSYTIYTFRNAEIEPVRLCQDSSFDFLVQDGGVCNLLFENIDDFKTRKKADILSRIDYSTTILDPKDDAKKKQNEEAQLPIPSHLKQFIDDMLDVWINSALTAGALQPGRDYLLQGGDAVPVDYKHTGVVQENMRWSDGLQQFLQLKHSLQMRPLGLETNFLSNLAFFRRYGKSVFGVSGTLGEEHEKNFMRETYKVQLNYIPPYRERRLVENPGIVTETKSECITKICQLVTQERNRPSLIVCEDINSADLIFEEVTRRCHGVKTKKYVKNEDTKDELQVGPGDVIVATNLAGRGTDVKVSDDAETAGGLHVLVTFLPLNQRVEEQVFGRSGRKGQRGSATLLLSREGLSACFSDCDSVEEMKQVRREASLQELKNHEEFALPEVEFKENLFKCISHLLSEYYHQIKKPPSSGTELEKRWSETDLKLKMDYLKEIWGMHLKKTLCHITDFSIERTAQCIGEVEKMFQEAKSNVESECSLSPFQALKFAEKSVRHEDFERAIDLYTKAINMNSSWSSIAYYNRAYAKIMKGNCDIREVMDDLKDAKARIAETWLAHATWTQLYSGARIQQENASDNDCEEAKKKTPKDQANKQVKEEASQDVRSEAANPQFRQCVARIRIISNYKTQIEKCLENLEEHRRAGDKIIAVSTCIKEIEKEPDSITLDELKSLYHLGHVRFFDVQKKPSYTLAIAVAIFGAFEIALGSALCYCGQVNVGNYFINEGINDIMAGVMGMIQGDFNLKAWLKNKAINIGVSLLTFGFRKVANYLKSSGKFASVAQKVNSAGSTFYTKAASVLNKVIGQNAVKFIKTIMSNPIVQKVTDYAISVAQRKLLDQLIEKLKQDVQSDVKEKCASEAESGKLHDIVLRLTAPLCLVKDQETSKIDLYDFSTLTDSQTKIILQALTAIAHEATDELMSDVKNTAKVIEAINSRLTVLKDEFSQLFKGILSFVRLASVAVDSAAIAEHAKTLNSLVGNTRWTNYC